MSALPPFNATPYDISAVLTGTAGQVLTPKNINRTFLQFQAPAGGLWYSFTNSTCTTSGTGCYSLSPTLTYLSGYVVPGSPIYIFGTAGQLVNASEC